MTISYGYVYSTEQEWETVYDIAKAADDRMYQSKEIFYTKNGSGKRKIRQFMQKTNMSKLEMEQLYKNRRKKLQETQKQQFSAYTEKTVQTGILKIT